MCTYVKKNWIVSRVFFSFGKSGDIRRRWERAHEREKEFIFFTHCLSFSKVHLSHTLDHLIYIYRQGSVPAIAGLLLGIVVALILIPISGSIRLLLWTMAGIITSIAAHRSPWSHIRTGAFRHISIVHLARWSFHTSILLILLHWIHPKATVVAHAHLIRWSTERLIVVVVVLWRTTECAKCA